MIRRWRIASVRTGRSAVATAAVRVAAAAAVLTKVARTCRQAMRGQAHRLKGKSSRRMAMRGRRNSYVGLGRWFGLPGLMVARVIVRLKPDLLGRRRCRALAAIEDFWIEGVPRLPAFTRRAVLQAMRPD
jgi:hypothetical protein